MEVLANNPVFGELIGQNVKNASQRAYSVKSNLNWLLIDG